MIRDEFRPRALVILVLLVAAATAFVPAGAFASSRVAGDFNGDGADDLAVGSPNENGAGGVINTGGVNVLYGAVGGSITGTNDQYFTQNSLGEFEEPSDQFGNAVAAGDFDNDGFDDLAIGCRLEDLFAVGGAEGMVHVVYGTAAGLDPATVQLWTQDVGAILGTADAGNTFGTSLAAGDLDADGVADLAIGVPEEDSGGAADAGAVNVIYGTAAVGLTDAGNQLWDQGGAIADSPEQADYFGNALAIGDMNGDGVGDLAIGAHGENIGAIGDPSDRRAR